MQGKIGRKEGWGVGHNKQKKKEGNKGRMEERESIRKREGYNEEKIEVRKK